MIGTEILLLFEESHRRKLFSFLPYRVGELNMVFLAFANNKIMLKKVAALHAGIDTVYSVAIFQLD